MPDQFIAFARSLVGRPIEFYSCFISYSTKDQVFADRLYADLQTKGVRCWFAPHDIRGGRKIHEQINEAIGIFDRLILILSTSSMNSEWVKTEIRKARAREVRDKVRVLFPISMVPFQSIRDWECFDADTGKDVAVEIREYYIPDFSNWNDNQAYQRVFDELITDLKTEDRRIYDPESHRFRDPDGRAYRLKLLFRKGISADHVFEWHGIVPPEGSGWILLRKEMDELWAAGRIAITGGEPRLRVYTDEPDPFRR